MRELVIFLIGYFGVFAIAFVALLIHIARHKK